MEQKTTKTFFRLNGGLNTDINELNFPDGYTKDEANYEILNDGSRRRRKGLAAEASQGSAKTVPTFRTASANQAYLWRNVAGDPTKNVMVYQQGKTLYFADADSIVSSAWEASSIDVSSFYASGATAANAEDVPLSFTQGRGFLFVTGPYVKAFYVSYDSTGPQYDALPIQIYARDFADIEDGIAVGAEPTGTITDDHRYNLRNRGWSEGNMASYEGTIGAHPKKSAIWYKGYKRTYDGSTAASLINPVDGVPSWDSAKLSAEIFGNSSAPLGSLVLDPYDTTTGYGGATGTATNSILTGWTKTGTGTWEVTITTDTAHGFNPGDSITISGMSSSYIDDDGIKKVHWYDGVKTAKVGLTETTAGTTIVFDTSPPELFASFFNQYRTLGYTDGNPTLVRSIGTAHTDSFNAIEFFAGHMFYGGMKNSEWADTIFFSQIATTEDKFGKCYQEADPTDPDFNSLVASDGGTIVIPGLSGVLNFCTVRNSLIVLGKNGVWEVSGGQRGVFTATGYSVRKLSDNAASSPLGFVTGEGIAMYTGPGGIYVIQPNQFTQQLEVVSVSDDRISQLWDATSTAEQENCQLIFDSALKKVYILLGPDGSTTMGVHTMLIFNARVGGVWSKYTFDTPSNNVLLTGFALPNVDDATNNQKMKFIYQVSTTSVNIADFNQTDFDDWDGTNGPLPYLVFGHDNLGEWQRRKQAPVITVFSKRTETGYTSTGGGFDPVNESSTLMSAYWDWTDDAVTNKIGAQQEVYRHVRNFVPSGTTDVDGYPVVTTRNKVRGRGRSLQLRFDGATDKDSHILGYQTNYKITRKI